MFSNRLPASHVVNRLTRRLEALRADGAAYVDLTESNPTRIGLAYPATLLQELSDSRALTYDPQPFGLPAARQAVAADFARRRTQVDPDHVVLTASTSEAYGWLFKMLCDPGDRVLVPRPSYPLFEHLTRLEAIEAAPYDLAYHGRWEIDFQSIADAITSATRAILVVSPNNPTGSYLTAVELSRLAAICAERGVALVADEVFVDYPLDAPADIATDVAVGAEALSFTLGGLSKSAGLPQLKLGWIVVGGAPVVRRKALDALELIADTYLSVSTPVQVAAAHLLAEAAVVRDQIAARTRENLSVLLRLVASMPAIEVLACEGGWYAVVRVPATRGEEDLVLDLLERERILVHPGYFFDFPREAYIVVSLLPAAAAFADAAARMLHFASRPI